ncbi:hypothetical protein, partial [Paenibacillus sp. AR247]|uniref:hypothetical protein n=1 Tax=Paenibacillus sp. AR247 TaxID=1631599 RepID=UPI001C614955
IPALNEKKIAYAFLDTLPRLTVGTCRPSYCPLLWEAFLFRRGTPKPTSARAATGLHHPPALCKAAIRAYSSSSS